jgi:hypothetical protein
MRSNPTLKTATSTKHAVTKSDRWWATGFAERKRSRRRRGGRHSAICVCGVSLALAGSLVAVASASVAPGQEQFLPSSVG